MTYINRNEDEDAAADERAYADSGQIWHGMWRQHATEGTVPRPHLLAIVGRRVGPRLADEVFKILADKYYDGATRREFSWQANRGYSLESTLKLRLAPTRPAQLRRSSRHNRSSCR